MRCRYRNQTGVQIRPLDWGGLRGLRALDPYLPQLTSVYGKLIKGLEAEGYQERVDLFGAPYDFRLAADGLEQACPTGVHAHMLPLQLTHRSDLPLFFPPVYPLAACMCISAEPYFARI